VVAHVNIKFEQKIFFFTLTGPCLILSTLYGCYIATLVMVRIGLATCSAQHSGGVVHTVVAAANAQCCQWAWKLLLVHWVGGSLCMQAYRTLSHAAANTVQAIVNPQRACAIVFGL
jgi:hypothetical protein